MPLFRFLLVENNSLDALAIQRELLEGGIQHELLRVTTRNDLINVMQHDRFDLILSSYTLPDFDGIAALEIAQSLQPEVPFIFVSGSLGEELAIETLKRGATDCVMKQHLARLIPCVQRALREVQAHQDGDQALQTSEAKYRQLFDSIAQSFCRCEMIFDDQGQPFDYRFLEVNRLFEQMTGLQDPVGKTARELVPNLEAYWFEIYGQVVQTREPTWFESQSIAMNRWFEINAMAMGGNQFAVLFTDISERKRVEAERNQAEQALSTSEEKVRTILDSITDAFFAVDSEWRFTYGNPTAYQLVNRTSGDLIGKNLWEEFPSLYNSPFEQVFRRVMQERVVEAVTEFYPDHNRWYNVHSYPVADGSLTLYFRDVTEQIRVKEDRDRLLQQEQAARAEAETANRLKDEFLAVLSHELRTPLNPILGWLRLLNKGKLDSVRQAEALKVIDRNAQLQAQLVEDLLDISRIMQGKFSLAKVPLKLSMVIAAAVETVRLTAEAKRIQIYLDLDSSVAPVSGDPARLQQVVWNLLSNAVKFTPVGGQVTVKLRQQEGIAQLQVIDTGKGINAAFLPHVFEYFRQEDGSTNRKFGGLGLGLAIARQIVELHGGTIRAASDGADQGATFTVELPVLLKAEPQTSKPSDLSATALPLANLNILLVDDDADARDYQTFVLKQSGAIVTAAASGREALQALEQSTPTLIVSDIGMAEMDGYQLMQQVRSRFSAETLPAIALTAYAGEIDRQNAIAAGFQQHVAKPVDPEEFVDVIVALVRKQFHLAAIQVDLEQIS